MNKHERMVPLAALEAERKKGKMRLAKMKEQYEETQKDFSGDENAIHIDEQSTVAESVSGNYLQEFAELVQNPNYSDSVQYVNELTAYAEQYNVPLKTAYNALYAEQKYEEIRRQSAEQKVARHQHKIEALDSGSAAPSMRKMRLTQEQLAAAEACGMTPEEYAKYM